MIMEKDSKELVGNNELGELFTSLRSSAVEFTNYREIAAWTITALYLTALYIITKHILQIQEFSILTWLFCVFIFFSFLMITFIVCVFIHAQYASHRSARTIHSSLTKFMFQAISGDLKKKDFRIDRTDNNIFPKIIIDDQREQEKKDDHSIKNISPLVMYRWFIQKIIYKKDQYNKFQLIESTIYNLVLIPLIISLLIITVHIFQISRPMGQTSILLIGIIIQLIISLAMIATFIVYFHQLRAMKKVAEHQNIIAIINAIREPEVRKAREFVITELSKSDYSKWGTKDKEEASTVCSSYDLFSILVLKKGFVKNEIFIDNWGPSILKCYPVVKPLIEEMQKPENNGPRYWNDFEKLYKLCLTYHKTDNNEWKKNNVNS